jgi:DNA-binding NarL/FixJ family response regulator
MRADSVSSVLRSNPALGDDPVELANLLADRLTTWPQDRWIAIDDYHLVSRSEQAEALVGELFAITDVPLLVTSRVRPAWAHARGMIYGEVAQLTTSALAMDDKEVAQALGANADIEKIREIAGGWPALISLATAVPDPAAPPGLAPEVVYDFFVEELIRGASPELEQALFTIAISPALIEFELNKRSNRDLFEDALTRGLILDGKRVSMHPLVRGFLLDKLGARPDAEEVTRQVAELLLARKYWDDAFEVIRQFGHVDLLDRLIAEASSYVLEEGRCETASRWSSLGRKSGSVSAALDYIDAVLLARRGDHEGALSLARRAAESLQPDDPLRPKATLLGARCAHMADQGKEAARLFEEASIAPSAHDRGEALFGLLSTQLEWEYGGSRQILDRIIALEDGSDSDWTLRRRTAEVHYYANEGPVQEGLRIAAATSQVAAASHNLHMRSSFFYCYGIVLILRGEYDAGLGVIELAVSAANDGRLKFAVPLIQTRMAAGEMGRRNFATAARVLELVNVAGRVTQSAYLRTAAKGLMTRLLVSQCLAEDALRPEYEAEDGSSPAAVGEHLAAQALASACVGDVNRARNLSARVDRLTRQIEARVLGSAARAIAAIHSDEAIDSSINDLIALVTQTGNVDCLVCAIRGSTELRTELEARLVGLNDENSDVSRALSIADTPYDRARGRRSQTSPLYPLSRREYEVLEHVIRGLSNRQIGKALFISEVTVKAHLRHIFEKLGVRSRTQAILWAQAARGNSGDL